MSLASGSGNVAKADNFFSFSQKIVKQKGFWSLYNGLSAGVTRQVFYASSRFGLFEVFRDELQKYRPTDIWSRLLAGCVSGATAALISCPAEVSLVRISNDNTLPLGERRNYKGVFDAFRRIAAEEGPKAFFNGSGPFVNRAILVGCVQVGTYDQLKDSYRKIGVTGQFSNVFCSSMTAGFLYACVTMPFETAKNRMAFQKPDSAGKFMYRSTIQTITAVGKADGVLALWNGFLPYYLRCGGHTVSMFVVVEYLRRAYLAFKKD